MTIDRFGVLATMLTILAGMWLNAIGRWRELAGDVAARLLPWTRRRHHGRHCPRRADAEADAHLAAMTPDPDRPVPYWPAYLPAPAPDSGRPVQASRPGDPPYVECGAVRAGATPQTPAAVSAPVDGAQERAATPSGVTAPLPGPATPHGAGQPPLADLVQAQAHPLAPGERLPRGEHPYPPMAGNWKETRSFTIVQDPHPVPRWYLVWLLRHPDGGPEITDADFNYAAGIA